MGTFTASALVHNPELIGRIADGSAETSDCLSWTVFIFIVSGAAISYVKYKRKRKEEKALIAESDLEKIAMPSESSNESNHLFNSNTTQL